MKKYLASAAIVAALFLSMVALTAATYNAVIMNNGSVTWFWQTDTNNQLGLFNGTNGAAFTVSLLGGMMLPASTFANLPTCATAVQGAVRVVTDSNTTTFNATSAGGGSSVVLAACDGTIWRVH